MAAAKKKKKNTAAEEAVLSKDNAASALQIESDNNAPVPESAVAPSVPQNPEAPKASEPAPEKNPENAGEKLAAEGPAAADKPESAEEKPATNEEPKTAEKPAPAPDGGKRVIKTSAQYSKSAEREKNIRKQVKKRKRRPVLLVLFLCSMLVLVAIVYNSLTREPENVQSEETGQVINTPPPAQIIVPTPTPVYEETEVTPQPEATEEPVPEATPEAQSEPVVEHSYQFFVEDISWEAARQRCQELGGYLAVISNSEELEQIITMAENYGVSHVWLGCHRVDGDLVWEHDGEYYYQWDSGEPSAYDYNDNVAEDYLMLWRHNGYWYYNDSRNDPCADYPAYYSGDMGFVCEFGSN